MLPESLLQAGHVTTDLASEDGALNSDSGASGSVALGLTPPRYKAELCVAEL